MTRGMLQPAFEADELPDERRAVAAAKLLSHQHVGVFAWSREANATTGEYGPSEVRFQHGVVPDLD